MHQFARLFTRRQRLRDWISICLLSHKTQVFLTDRTLSQLKCYFLHTESNLLAECPKKSTKCFYVNTYTNHISLRRGRGGAHHCRRKHNNFDVGRGCVQISVLFSPSIRLSINCCTFTLLMYRIEKKSCLLI